MARLTHILPSSLVPRSLSLLATGAAVMYYYDPKNGRIRRQRAGRYLEDLISASSIDWQQAKVELQSAFTNLGEQSALAGNNGSSKRRKSGNSLESSAVPRVAARCLIGYAGLKTLPHMSLNSLAFLAATTSFLLPSYAKLKERTEIESDPQLRIE